MISYSVNTFKTKASEFRESSKRDYNYKAYNSGSLNSYYAVFNEMLYKIYSTNKNHQANKGRGSHIDVINTVHKILSSQNPQLAVTFKAKVNEIKLIREKACYPDDENITNSLIIYDLDQNDMNEIINLTDQIIDEYLK